MPAMRHTRPAGNDGVAPGLLPRAEGVEWLDTGRGTPADAAANLAEMWRLNRWLGGLRSLTRHLYPRLERGLAPVTVLDLGAGAADVAATVAGWARRRGLAVRVIAAEWAARNLSAARARRANVPGLSLLQADAVRLPLAAGSVDFVISTLLLHHFAPPAAVELLRSAFAHARRGLIMSDLVRGRLPLWAFRLAQPVFARHPFTRHDGALSIRRAYTPAEALALAQAAGLPNPRVHAHWPWRLTLVADRDAGA
jgi:2-polyprenyl-3-methyl-5-hydroxy-6-metoxy-1,4-benzoquinol methylase